MLIFIVSILINMFEKWSRRLLSINVTPSAQSNILKPDTKFPILKHDNVGIANDMYYYMEKRSRNNN